MALMDVLNMGLLYGAIVTVVFVAAILLTFRWNPEIWVQDLPPKLRDRYGPVGPSATRDSRIAGVAMFSAIGVILVYAILRLFQRAGGNPGFWAIFLLVFVALQTANVIDLVIIDWLFVATIKAKPLMIPGTEDWEGHDDYAFHFRAFLKGFVGMSVASAIFAGMAMLIGSFVA